MNWTFFLSIFSLIFVAELPDKTAFATLFMATQGSPLAIFIGVALAFVIQSLIAVTFGGMIGHFPERWVHLIAGVLFLIFAVLSWTRHSDEKQEEEVNAIGASSQLKFFKTVWKAFIVIFIAEWGDLTQLATASFSARDPDSLWTIFCAATSALWAVSALAVFLGHRLKHVVQVGILSKVSALAFGAVGIYFIWAWFSTA